MENTTVMNEVYTDYEGFGFYKPNEDVTSNPVYDFVFHFNHYTGLWNAIPRSQYTDYWNGSLDATILKSKSIETLVELINRTEGDLDKINELTSAE